MEDTYFVDHLARTLKATGTEKKHAHCPKCGAEVLGDEDGLCGNCVAEELEEPIPF